MSSNETTSRFKYGTTMLIKENTKERLDSLGLKKGSYDNILNDILDELEQFRQLKALPKFNKFVEENKIKFLTSKSKP